MLKKLFFLLMVVFFSCMLSAEISTEEREKLKNELKDEIKKELKEDLKKEKNILDMFSLNGKIKTRYEFEKKAKIDRSGHDTRHRGVFEAKLGFVFRPVDYFKAGFGLASGAETPVSSNETMKGQASSKPIFLDLAYIEVHPYYKWISLLTGKFRNPLFKAGGSQMVWDNDVNPEGAALSFKYDFGQFNLFGSGALHILEEFKVEPDDPFMAVLQLGAGLNISGVKFNVAVSYSDTINLEKKLTQSRAGSDTDYSYSYSNSVSLDDKYVYDYNVLGVDADFSYTAHKYFMITLFGQFYSNVAKDVEERYAYIYGIKISSEKMKKPGDYCFEFRSRHVDRDAYLDSFTDGTFYYGRTGIVSYDLAVKAAIWNDVTFDVLYSRQMLKTTDGVYNQPIDSVQLNFEVKF